MSRRRNESTIQARRHPRGRDRRHDTQPILAATIAGAEFHEIVELVNESRPPAATGRPRVHSHATLCFIEAVTAHFQSARKAHAYLNSGSRWEGHRRHLAQRFPTDPLLRPGAPLPSRTTFQAFHAEFPVHAAKLAALHS